MKSEVSQVLPAEVLQKLQQYNMNRTQEQKVLDLPSPRNPLPPQSILADEQDTLFRDIHNYLNFMRKDTSTQTISNTDIPDLTDHSPVESTQSKKTKHSKKILEEARLKAKNRKKESLPSPNKETKPFFPYSDDITEVEETHIFTPDLDTLKYKMITLYEDPMVLKKLEYAKYRYQKGKLTDHKYYGVRDRPDDYNYFDEGNETVREICHHLERGGITYEPNALIDTQEASASQSRVINFKEVRVLYARMDEILYGVPNELSAYEAEAPDTRQKKWSKNLATTSRTPDQYHFPVKAATPPREIPFEEGVVTVYPRDSKGYGMLVQYDLPNPDDPTWVTHTAMQLDGRGNISFAKLIRNKETGDVKERFGYTEPRVGGRVDTKTLKEYTRVYELFTRVYFSSRQTAR